MSLVNKKVLVVVILLLFYFYCYYHFSVDKIDSPKELSIAIDFWQSINGLKIFLSLIVINCQYQSIFMTFY